MTSFDADPGLDLAEHGSAPESPDAAKAFVMAALSRVAKEGGAVITTLEFGALELRLETGEVFHLGEAAVTRIA